MQFGSRQKKPRNKSQNNFNKNLAESKKIYQIEQGLIYNIEKMPAPKSPLNATAKSVNKVQDLIVKQRQGILPKLQPVYLSPGSKNQRLIQQQVLNSDDIRTSNDLKANTNKGNSA